jgi:hypothetical protein
MSNRFFKTSQEVYDAARESLDDAFGHPNGRADTCLPREPLTDTDGNVVLAILTTMTEWPEVASLIDSLLESGQAFEISQKEYAAAFPETL